MGLFRSRLFQSVLVLVVTFAVFRFAIRPPAPWSVITLYMGVVLLALLVYVSSDGDSWRAFVAPLRALLVDDSLMPIRVVAMIVLPLGLGYYAYSQAAATVEAPPELRAVHPAPPASISFRGKPLDIQGLDNPLRKDAAGLKQHAAEGGSIYIKNCMYCHGDNLDGAGPFAHAFNPPPANFQDPGTIAMLQEAYLFWRIAKGGPGLPKESTPWNSVMPAWEDRLSAEEIWKVIVYLYDATGYQPRRWEEGGEPKHSRLAVPVKLAGLPGMGLLTPRAVEAQQVGDPAQGKAVYEKKCLLCHGEKGDGAGPGAPLLEPRPRDFTKGKFKIRTSASGQVPTDADLFRIITEGMPGTTMPGWKGLSEKDRWSLVAYLKTFAPEAFKEAPKRAVLPKEVAASKESLARGKEMFEAIECHKCHGAGGRGDGPSAAELRDDWKHPVRPANLTKPWNFRGGSSTKEIATRLATGLMGTPMPTFIDSVEKPEDIWHVANYVKALGTDKPAFATMLTVRAVAGPIPDDPAAAFWRQQPAAVFPLAGQVIVEPRNVNPSIDTVTVRAVYTGTEIAFHLSWDDPTKSMPDATAKTFADQIALQLAARPAEGSERPYVLMGDGSSPVYLLRWASDAGVGEASASGLGTLAPQTGQAVQATGGAVFADGQYRLVIKRPRVTKDPGDPAFPVGRFLSVAVMAWDGGAGETESKLSFSSWYYLRLEEPGSTTPYLIPPLVVLVAAALELLVVRRARGRASAEPRRPN
ncbi:MAG: c-type cytochrome [Candidatus Rokubacteria bacterium]|nr:c-type cytochrome [Candidatus Rokubacteria bacterium]